jgi:hypothetical protein
MTTKPLALAVLAAVTLLGSTPWTAHADTITEYTAADGATISARFGQSLMTPSGGPWHDLTFNFFTDVPPTTPTAAGTAFLLTQEYLGTPAALSSSTPGFLAQPAPS